MDSVVWESVGILSLKDWGIRKKEGTLSLDGLWCLEDCGNSKSGWSVWMDHRVWKKVEAPNLDGPWDLEESESSESG